MKALETPRLVLRPFRESDFDDYFEYASNPHVGPNAGWPAHTDRTASMKILRSFIEGEEVWAIEEKSSGKVIGSFGLHPDRKRDGSHVKVIGYVLSESYWAGGT